MRLGVHTCLTRAEAETSSEVPETPGSWMQELVPMPPRELAFKRAFAGHGGFCPKLWAVLRLWVGTEAVTVPHMPRGCQWVTLLCQAAVQSHRGLHSTLSSNYLLANYLVTSADISIKYSLKEKVKIINTCISQAVTAVYEGVCNLRSESQEYFFIIKHAIRAFSGRKVFSESKNCCCISNI